MENDVALDEVLMNYLSYQCHRHISREKPLEKSVAKGELLNCSKSSVAELPYEGKG